MNYFQCFQIMQQKYLNPGLILTKELKRRIELNLKFSEQLYKPNCPVEKADESDCPIGDLTNGTQNASFLLGPSPNYNFSGVNVGARSTNSVEFPKSPKSFSSQSFCEIKGNRRSLDLKNKENCRKKLKQENMDFDNFKENKKKPKSAFYKTIARKYKSNLKCLKKIPSFTPKFKNVTKRIPKFEKRKNLLELLENKPQRNRLESSEKPMETKTEDSEKRSTKTNSTTKNQNWETNPKSTFEEDDFLKKQKQQILDMIWDGEEEFPTSTNPPKEELSPNSK